MTAQQLKSILSELVGYCIDHNITTIEEYIRHNNENHEEKIERI